MEIAKKAINVIFFMETLRAPWGQGLISTKIDDLNIWIGINQGNIQMTEMGDKTIIGKIDLTEIGIKIVPIILRIILEKELTKEKTNNIQIKITSKIIIFKEMTILVKSR